MQVNLIKLSSFRGEEFTKIIAVNTFALIVQIRFAQILKIICTNTAKLIYIISTKFGAPNLKNGIGM